MLDNIVQGFLHDSVKVHFIDGRQYSLNGVHFRKNPQAAESLRGPILEEKVVDFIIELAKVTENVVSIDELTKEPEPAG